MARCLLYVAAGLIVVVVVFCAGFFFGALAGEWGTKQRRFSDEKRAIIPVLSADPAFARLGISMYTGDGSAYLEGEVATKADLERLRSRMGDLFGKAGEVERLSGVWSVEAPPNPTLPQTQSAGASAGNSSVPLGVPGR